MISLKKTLFENITVKQTIFKNTFWLMLAEGISKGLMFFLTILIARYLGAEGYGIFSFVFAFVALFAVIADFGLSILTIREVARDKSLTKKYIDNIAVMKLILGVIAFILIIIAAQFLNKTPEVRTLIYLAGIWIIIQNFTQFFQSIFRAFEKMQYEALSKIIYSCLLFGIVFFVIWQNLEIKAIIQSYIYASLIAFIFTFILIRKNFTKFWTKIDFDFWKGLLKEAWPFLLSSIFFMIYFKIDTVMLGMLSTNKEVGIYNAAYIIYAGIFILPEIITISFFPKMSETYKKNREIFKKIFFNFRNTLIILSFPLFALLFFWNNLIINFFYNQEYQGSILILKILSIILLFRLFTYSYGWFLTSTDEQKQKVKSQGICALANIILNYFLIIKYHAIGAAVATLITELILLNFYYFYFRKKWNRIYTIKID